MIGIQLAGKKDRIPASVFLKSLSSFVDLLGDVDSVLSKVSKGSLRWDIVSLTKNSPAVVEFEGVPRIERVDHSRDVQQSVLEGIEQLADRPEEPRFYSYSALTSVKIMAGQAKHLKWLSVFFDGHQVALDNRVYNNVEYIIGRGSKSLGSVRGSLDALMVHSGHEFRIWSPKRVRPITCRFTKEMLPTVIKHIKQEVEVVGELQRNPKGEPVVMTVQEFIPLEPVRATPSILEMSGLVPDLYEGQSLKEYIENLRQ